MGTTATGNKTRHHRARLPPGRQICHRKDEANGRATQGSGSSEEKAPATQSAGSSGQAAKQALAPAPPAPPASPAANNSSGDNTKIGIEDFSKIELRVG